MDNHTATLADTLRTLNGARAIIREACAALGCEPSTLASTALEVRQRVAALEAEAAKLRQERDEARGYSAPTVGGELNAGEDNWGDSVGGIRLALVLAEAPTGAMIQIGQLHGRVYRCERYPGRHQALWVEMATDDQPTMAESGLALSFDLPLEIAEDLAHTGMSAKVLAWPA